jgi:hypothetical protein
MKEKQAFIKSINTLFFSWGSEAPAEVFWGANDLLDWFEKEYNVKLGIRFDEENPDNFEEVIEAIKNS